MTNPLPWCIVPVKSRHAAKQRLASLLEPAERANLVETMLSDVLDALSAVQRVCGVIVVTGDARLAVIARGRGLRVIDDVLNRGTATAVSIAAAALARDHAASLLVLHADLPLATPEAIEAVLSDAGKAPTLTLVPDLKRRGTNALLARPIDVVPFCFGLESFRRHREAAAARGICPRVLDLRELAHDVDCPEDLGAVIGGGGATAAYLVESGIAERLSRLNRHRETVA